MYSYEQQQQNYPGYWSIRYLDRTYVLGIQHLVWLRMVVPRRNLSPSAVLHYKSRKDSRYSCG